MKKLLLSVCALALAFGAQAQKAQKTQSDAELGKKWYVAERYSKALPYLERASEAGDVDSKARLAYMIYTAQVPEYSMDQDEAMNMLDECIEKGSTLAMERKGMCLLAFPPETKENRLKAIEILKEASDKGSGDASANLFNAYANGITSYARNEVYVEPNDSLALVYIKKACEQGNQTGKAFVGLYTYNGIKGYTQDKAAGVKMMEEANAMSTRFFATDCFEPAKALVEYYKANGQTAKATPIVTLLKKFHPTEY